MQRRALLWGAFLLVFPFFSGVNAQVAVELEVLAHMHQYSSYNDCWGYTAPDGREYALLGVQNGGTSIVDITDAPTVTEIAFIPGSNSLWRDMKTYRSYAYSVNESGGGLQIIDLSDLPNSASLAATYNGFSTAHNIEIDTTNALMYVEGEGGAAVRTLSLADPVNPVQLSTFGIECHDMYPRGNLVYVSEGGSGSVGVYDLSNPSSPTLAYRHSIPAAGYVHNAWLSDDGNYLITTEETTGKTVKYWDISNTSSIFMTDEYLSFPSQLAHNAFIKGDYAYISHYDDGMKVLDVSNPSDIFETAYYDTYNGSGLGCWGTFPFFQSGKIIASDVETGLWVFYFEGAVGGDQLDPMSPTAVASYSDYTTPASIHLTWVDPVSLVDGTPLNPGDFTIEVKRDGINVGSAPGGAGEFTDNGLVEGQAYAYLLYASLIANDSTSREVGTGWIAGGSPVPDPPTEVSVQGDDNSITITWRNTSTNDDGTPINDIAGVRLYQDGILVSTFDRTPSVAGLEDSASYSPSVAGFYGWHLITIDEDDNESTSSPVAYTPLAAPFSDLFTVAGPPDAQFWINQNGAVNDRGINPPSTPYSLNLNGHPTGGDIVDLRPFDLSSLGGSGVSFSYSWQAQGTGNAPETADSLMVFFRNDLGQWIKVRSYAGRSNTAFASVDVDIAGAPAGGGTFFHSQFQVRLQSYGTSDPVNLYDDWFVDNVSLSFPTGIDHDTDQIPVEFAMSQNFPNPFNPTTTFTYDVPVSQSIRLSVYNLLGERVKTIVDGVVEAGTHREIWDGTNDLGAGVVSGVYFYRLQGSEFSITRKMMLMR